MTSTKLRKTITDGMHILERLCDENVSTTNILREAIRSATASEKDHRRGGGHYMVSVHVAAYSLIIRLVLRAPAKPTSWASVATMRPDAPQCYALAELLGAEKLAELAAHPSALIDYAEDIAR